VKGILLAGGSGSRLWPTTSVTSKHLLPIYDKPLIYYSLSVLLLADIRDILIITTPKDLQAYKVLLGNGENFGINIDYVTQERPNGLAEAFLLGEEFIGNDNVCLILGDNLFWGQGLSKQLINAKSNLDGATIFGYRVLDPQRFGVIELDQSNNVKSIEEKPRNPKSNIASTGLYFYDNQVIKFAKSVKPSARGELEITSVNNQYLNQNSLKVEMLGRGFAWLDTGTSSSLLEASSFVETIERQQGYKIACLEEIALNKGWIDKKILLNTAEKYLNSSYGKYLMDLLNE